MNDSPDIILLCRDLMFVSKTIAAARVLEVPVRVFRDPETVAQIPGSKLIVDLAMPGAIEAAREWKRLTGRQVVGFVSHVDAETTQKSKDAGLDRVVTRGQFDRDVETILKS